MEKQRIFYAKSEIQAEAIANRLYDKEWRLTHNVKTLHRQSSTTWLFVLETCEKKSLKLQKDLSFKMC